MGLKGDPCAEGLLLSTKGTTIFKSKDDSYRRQKPGSENLNQRIIQQMRKPEQGESAIYRKQKENIKVSFHNYVKSQCSVYILAAGRWNNNRGRVVRIQGSVSSAFGSEIRIDVTRILFYFFNNWPVK